MTADFRQLQRQFSAHIRDRDTFDYPGIEDRRLRVYRELFYNNIEGFLRRGFPFCTKSSPPATAGIRWYVAFLPATTAPRLILWKSRRSSLPS